MPASASSEEDDSWRSRRTARDLVTFFGSGERPGLGMRAYERMQLSGTFAPWSNQFEAMSYVSFAIIAATCSWSSNTDQGHRAFVVSSDSSRWAPRRSSVPLSGRGAAGAGVEQLLIYIHVSITLTSYAAFAMAAARVMYLLKERAERRGAGHDLRYVSSLEKIDELGYKSS